MVVFNSIVKNVKGSIQDAIDKEEYRSIEHFCNSNDISKAVVSKMLRDEKVPTLLTLIRIKRALGISFDEMVGE